jgi:hypothetical protein
MLKLLVIVYFAKNYNISPIKIPINIDYFQLTNLHMDKLNGLKNFIDKSALSGIKKERGKYHALRLGI